MIIAGYALGSAVAVRLLAQAKARLELSMAKHRSVAGHARMARRIASLIPFYEYDNERFFRCDNPEPEVAARRRDGFLRLSQLYRQRFPKTHAITAQVAVEISDLQFTSAYRVPFQFSRYVREHLPAGSFLESSSGVTVTDLDGNAFYDLAGSYGVNLFGQDFYKDCIARGAERVRGLGPVLGAYHPAVASNVAKICRISGL